MSSLLSPGLIFLRRSYAGKDEMIDELVREVFRTRYKINCGADEVKAAIRERESLGGTIFPTGLAVPHARLENFDDILIIVCVPASPVSFEDKNIRIMVLVLTGHATSTLYLNTLAAFAKISADTEFFEKLLAVSSSQNFIQLLKERNIEVKKEVLVESIMSHDYHVLHPDNTVKEAVDAFYKYHTTYIPILEEDGTFAGELTVFDVFGLGIPHYAEKVGNLKFLKSFEQFETLLDTEELRKIREVMKKYTVTLEEDSPIIEAIMKITQEKRRNIPVVRDGRLVGIVTTMDIIHKVLRA
ncbi:MAG: PTS sugar transporter subunit IIA [Spirochaetales bacterium]|nr:PTS sugar transporter subunit IIA [Spirochaetales bacterium]